MYLLNQEPEINTAEASCHTRVSYLRLLCWLKGTLSSHNLRSVHNKKFTIPEDKAPNNYLLMCYMLGMPASIEQPIAFVNSVIRMDNI
jgi:hypothetical protein